LKRLTDTKQKSINFVENHVDYLIFNSKKSSKDFIFVSTDKLSPVATPERQPIQEINFYLKTTESFNLKNTLC